MNRPILPKLLPAVVAVSLLLQIISGVVAQKSYATVGSENGTAGREAQVNLSSGAVEVLKLFHAQVGEDTIAAFIANSGSAYNLGANEIIYLKGQGLSDQLLRTMLEQQRVTPAVATTAQPASAGPMVQPASYVPGGKASYVQAPPYTPSTVYVAPSPVAYPYDYYNYPAYYPYYGSYWGSYPAVSFSVGLGGCYNGGFYYGSGYPWRGYWGGGYRGGYGYYRGGYGGYGGFHGGFSGGGFHVSTSSRGGITHASMGGGFHGGGFSGHHR